MGQHYGEKADVFSLGVVISELDTHELPYAHAKESGSGGRSLPDTAVLQMVSLGKLRVRFSAFMNPDEVPQVLLLQSLQVDLIEGSQLDDLEKIPVICAVLLMRAPVKKKMAGSSERESPEMEGMAQALAASGGAESSLADQSSAFTVEESADDTLAPVGEVSLARAEGDDAVQSVAQEDVEMKRAKSAADLLEDDDEKMEEAETTTLEDESYAKKASQAVWKVIKSLAPGGTKRADLDVDDRTLLELHGNWNTVLLVFKLNDLLSKAYKGVDAQIWLDHGLEIFSSVKEALIQPTKAEMDRRKQLATAFTGTYSGSAHDEFQKYLTRCCELYRANPSVYLAPYVA
ncbi:hypothetical protein PF011_g28442, partial [Phytophthora fragariae]